MDALLNWEVPTAFENMKSDLQLGVVDGDSYRDEIALVLDWDDTLFPSTWLLEDVGVQRQGHLEEQLSRMKPLRAEFIRRRMQMLAEKTEELLNDACRLATVFIVTLAKEGWVEMSIRDYMPSLKKFLDSGLIKILHAEKSAASTMQCQKLLSDKGKLPDDEIVLDELIQVKADAIFQALSTKSDNSHQGKWQSIISIGDSDFERYGTMKASRRYSEGMEGCSKMESSENDSLLTRKPWTTTLKMLDDPTVEELVAQLTVIRRWLPFLVKQQDGMDLEIESSEEDSSLTDLHQRITGLQEVLSWEDLACLQQLE